MSENEKASKAASPNTEQFEQQLRERLEAKGAGIKTVGEETGIKPEGAAKARPRYVIDAKPKPGEAKPEPEPQPEPSDQQPETRVQLPVPVHQRPTTNYDEALVAMNDHHAIIDNVGDKNSKAVIAGWEPSSLDPTKLVLAFQSKESFLLRYSNRYVIKEVSDGNGGSRTISQPLGQWWLGHPNRLQFRSVTFMPLKPKVVNGCLNLWRGWGVDPAPGDWSLIQDHIETVIANGNAEAADYVIRWIAWSIQHPDRQAEVALVLIGEKGTGKGTLVRCLERIFGDHAFQVTGREEVIGKFNGHLQDCILFVADEAYWGGDKRCVGRLQGMITEPTLPIERKGIDLIQVRNLLHVVMLAEPGWVIPAGRFERRYAALEISSARRRERDYFRALRQQIDEGGAEAMFHDLREMDLGDWHPRDLPESLLNGAALQKQQGHTLPPLEQWYLSLLHNGSLPGALSKRPNTAPTCRQEGPHARDGLIDDARDKFPRLRYDLSENGLRNFLVESPEKIGISCTKYRDAKFNGWSFPPLAECREAWESKYGAVNWDNPIEEWAEPIGQSAPWPPKVDPKHLADLTKPARFDLKAVLAAIDPSTAAEAEPPSPSASQAQASPKPRIIMNRRI
jgi:hypothetical protein